jgi:hypothetical protein
MTIDLLTLHGAQLPTDADPLTFSARADLLMEYVTSSFGPELNVIAGQINAALNGNSTTVGGEASTRAAADTALGGQITAEATARANADTSEASTRAAADTALSGRIDGKQATVTGAATSIVGSNLTASRALASDASGKVAAATTTATELGYLSGVTSGVQGQLNAEATARAGADTTEASTRAAADTALGTRIDGKQATVTGAATSIVGSNLTASRALASDASGKVVVATTTATELGYLSGVTSGVQGQLNAEATARANADTSEASTRAAADTALGGQITAEATARANADTTEASTRAAADAALSGQITAEATARANADTSEASTRAAADTALSGRIDVLKGANAGATAPAAPVAGMGWLDTSVAPAVLKTRDGTNAAWNVNDLAAVGLGVGLTALTSDLDAIVLSGFHNCAGTAVGAPYGGVYWSVEHRALGYQNTEHAIQFATSYGLQNLTRRKNAGVWGGWIETPDERDFTASFVASAGYQKLPGRFIMQWGTASYLASSGATGLLVTLPITFPNGILGASGNDTGGGANSVGANPLSASTIRLWGKNAGTYTNTPIFYQAIGY